MIRRFFTHFIESLKSLKRNGWMTIAAVFSVTLTLSLVGIFVSIILNAAKLGSDMANNVRINVYLRADSTDQSEMILNEAGETVANPSYLAVYNQIDSLENVESVTYSSKQEQLDKLTENMGDTWKLFEGDANPLYDAYIVDTTDHEYVKTVAEQIAQIDGVTEVRDSEVQTDKIFKLADLLKLWGTVGTVLLIVTATLLISNTIRITIISRSREIQIMRLVGAKNSYIRGPFLLEGAWVGMLGAIAPSALVYFVYRIAYEALHKSLESQNLSLISQSFFIPTMIASLFLAGIVIGAIGSTISMSRFLKI